MPSDDREQQFERALARHLRGTHSDSLCADAEILAAYHERALSLEEMARWKEHIAQCERCQETLAALEKTEAAVAEDWQQANVVAATIAIPHAVPATMLRAGSSQAIPSQELTAATIAVAKSVDIRKPAKLKKWTLPLGAIAAALLAWIGYHEYRTLPEKATPPVQVAENHETQVHDLGLPKQQAPLAVSPAPKEVPAAAAKDSKTETKPEVVAGARNGIGSGSGAGTAGRKAEATERLVAPKDKVSVTGKGAARSEAVGQDALDNAGQSVAKAPPPPPPGYTPSEPQASPAPPSLHQAERGRADMPSTPAKPPNGGPLISAQANQNASGALKQQEQKKEKDIAASSAISATALETGLAKGVLTLRDIANQTPSVIVAPDNKHAWRVGAAGKIEHSADEGRSWKAQKSGTTSDLLAGSAVSKKVCWVVGKVGILLRTTDGGKTWEKITSPIRGDLGGVHAQDELHASIWDVRNHESYETGDGGSTWSSTANE